MFREWVCSEFPADKYIGILTEVQSAKRRNHLSLIPATNAEFWRLRYNKSNHLFFLQDPGSNMDRLCMHHRYPGGVQSLKSTRNWDPKSHFILKLLFPLYISLICISFLVYVSDKGECCDIEEWGYLWVLFSYSMGTCTCLQRNLNIHRITVSCFLM